MTIDERKLALFGDLVARLSRPLGDRAAILWQARLDESRYRELEAYCLSALASEPGCREEFVAAFVRRRRALDGEAEAAAPAAPPPQPVDEQERMMQTLPLGPVAPTVADEPKHPTLEAATERLVTHRRRR